MSRQLPRIGRLSCVLATSFLLLAFAGCEGGNKEPSPAADGPEITVAAPLPSVAGLAILAKADAADGATDKVVSKCLTCNLGMDGDSQHVAKMGAYQLHLCSAECKGKFEAAPEKALLSLGIRGDESHFLWLSNALADNDEARTLLGRSRVGHRLRAFAAYGLGLMADRNPDPGFRERVYERLVYTLGDDRPEIQAAAAVAVGRGSYPK